MHEHGLASGIVCAVERAAHAERARKVTAVRVRVPALRPVSTEHLRLHFERAAAGTVAAGARLDILTDAGVDAIALEQIEVED